MASPRLSKRDDSELETVKDSQKKEALKKSQKITQTMEGNHGKHVQCLCISVSNHSSHVPTRKRSSLILSHKDVAHLPLLFQTTLSNHTHFLQTHISLVPSELTSVPECGDCTSRHARSAWFVIHFQLDRIALFLAGKACKNAFVDYFSTMRREDDVRSTSCHR